MQLLVLRFKEKQISYWQCALMLTFFSVQVTALSNVEAKKRFEFLEAVSGTMDAHLRYFKQVIHTTIFLFFLWTVCKLVVNFFPIITGL